MTGENHEKFASVKVKHSIEIVKSGKFTCDFSHELIRSN
jgi:hypothetical protein